MAKASHPIPFRGFDYVIPLANHTYGLQTDGKVEVTVRDFDQGQASYTATLFPFLLGSGSAAATDTEPLVQQGTTNLFSAHLDPGAFTDPAAGVNNYVVRVTSTISGSLENPFRLVHSLSGSQTFAAALARCQFCKANEPIPAALQLQLASPVTAGTCADCGRLNRPTVLVHGQQAGYECSWLSEPIDFCADPTAPAFWMLRKSDARTWDLFLRRGRTDVAAYRFATRADKDCSFPITLQFVAGGAECRDWPPTVIVTPAP